MDGTTPISTDDRPEKLLERVQELQEAFESAGDSAPRGLLEELLTCVVQMYGVGLERIITTLDSAGAAGQQIAAGLCDDPLVATLLLIHDLHPVPLADRVQAALDSVRPYMESHGGNVELLSLEDGIARIHLRGSCSDCSASSVTLELAIKQALEEMAPDLTGLQVEGLATQTLNGSELPMVTGSGSSGMELPVINSTSTATPSWFDVDPLGELGEGTLTAVAVAGRELVIANVEGTLLAYRDVCAACGGQLRGGSLRAGALSCPHCERSFFLPRAGRSMDDGRIQLEPVPLLREGGRVKVAVAA